MFQIGISEMEGEAPGMGWEHKVDSQGLDQRYKDYLNISQDLLEIEDFKREYDLYLNQYLEGTY